MGLNARGVFVGLTNRPAEQVQPGRRSRGLLVLDALGHERAETIARTMTRTRLEVEARYNPFHLLYADGTRAFLTHLDQGEASTRELLPGAHVICNRDEDDPRSRKAGLIRKAVDRVDFARPLDGVLEALADVLRSHAPADSPLENACVHAPGYGTRSSSLVASGESGSTWLFADGPPCEAKYTNYTRLLDGFRQAPTDRGGPK